MKRSTEFIGITDQDVTYLKDFSFKKVILFCSIKRLSYNFITRRVEHFYLEHNWNDKLSFEEKIQIFYNVEINNSGN